MNICRKTFEIRRKLIKHHNIRIVIMQIVFLSSAMFAEHYSWNSIKSHYIENLLIASHAILKLESESESASRGLGFNINSIFRFYY